MAPQVGLVLWHDDEMANAGFDDSLASWAQIPLLGRVRLHRCDRLVHPNIAQMITAAIRRRAPSTMATSASDRSLGAPRNGLNPMSAWYCLGDHVWLIG